MKPFYEQPRAAWISHQQNLDFPLHIHDAIELVYVLRGTSVVNCDSRQYVLQPGDIFLAFPHQVHGYEQTADFDGYILIASSSTLDNCREMLTKAQPAQPVIHATGEAAEQLLTLLRMMWQDRKNAPKALLQGYCLVLLNKLVALTGTVSRSTRPDTLQTILRYIGEHYREPITRAELAQAVGYNESYISHLISTQLQMPLTDYITMLRLDDARHLLQETEIPIHQISLTLGFPSVRSFNRYFLQAMEMSPTAYRSKKRNYYCK